MKEFKFKIKPTKTIHDLHPANPSDNFGHKSSPETLNGVWRLQSTTNQRMSYQNLNMAAPHPGHGPDIPISPEPSPF
jgi:hypothetical protein